MGPLRSATAALVLGGLACGSTDDDVQPPHDEPLPPKECRAGETELADGTCEPAGLPADMKCAPGQIDDGDACREAGIPPSACASGFVPDGDIGCAPVLPAMKCSVGTMAVPGDGVCHPVSECASDPWPAAPADAPVEYVDAAYAGGASDGTTAHPWTSIQSAIDAAPAGAVVAVAAGKYSEDLTVAGKPIRLWGACASSVELSSGGSNLVLEIGKGANGTELRDLSFAGLGTSILVTGSEDVTFERLWIHDVQGRGISAEDEFGPTSVTVRGSLVEHARGAAIADIGSRITIESSVLRDTVPGVGEPGAGILGDDGPSAEANTSVIVRGSVLEANTGMGAYGLGTALTVEATVIRDTAAGDSDQGWGIGVRDDPSGARGTLTVRGSIVERNREVGVSAIGSDVTIESTIVRDTQTIADGEAGAGIRVSSQSGQPLHAEVRTSVIERNHVLGIFVFGADVLVEGTAVRDTAPQGDGTLGRGLEAQYDFKDALPATVALRSCAFDRNHDAGVAAIGATVSLEACAVRDTAAAADERSGWGVSAYPEATTRARSTLTMKSSLVSGSRDIGVAVVSSDADIADSVVRDTQPLDSGSYGRGLVVQDATAKISRILLEKNHEMGLLVIGPDVVVEDAAIIDTLANGLGSFGDGICIASAPGATTQVRITGTRVANSARASLSNFGAHVLFGTSVFECSQFDIEAEEYLGATFSFEYLGGNHCGCPASDECQVLSESLEPPEALPPDRRASTP